MQTYPGISHFAPLCIHFVPFYHRAENGVYIFKVLIRKKKTLLNSYLWPIKPKRHIFDSLQKKFTEQWDGVGDFFLFN